MRDNLLRGFLGGALLVTGACVDMDAGAGDADLAERHTVAIPDVVVSTLDPSPPPTVLTTAGRYRVTSTLDVEAQALVPPTAFAAIQTLEGLRDHPAQTLFDLAEDAGVPAVGTIRDALPAVLESRLYGWIDGYVQGVTTGDGTVAQVLDGVLAVCHADVAQVQLGSRLTLDGSATAVHRLDTVELDVLGRALTYDVAPLAGVGVVLEVPVAATCTADGALTLGAHGFGLPYGTLAWRAVEDLVRVRYGRDLRGLLGAQLDCAALAASVANRCVLGQCVGHATELTQICNAGLDRAVNELRTRVEAATVEPLAFAAGHARLVDGHVTDLVTSDLEGGVWTAHVDLGQGARPAPATFTGVRE